MQLEQIRKLIARYLSGVASETERKAVDSWIQWVTMRGLPHSSEKLARVRNDIWQSIEASQTSSAPPLSRVTPLLRYIASIAAIVLVGFVLFSTIKHRERSYYSTDMHETKDILLIDGTRVKLKENTHLTVHDNLTNNDERLVELVEGEAHFQVQKDHRRPFVITNRYMRTEVLGTSFTVRSSGYSGRWDIRVSTGKVRVSKTEDQGASYILSAGDSLTYSEKGGVTAYISGTADIDEPILFYNENLSVVMQKLARRFNRTIYVASHIGYAKRFSGEFSHDYSLEDLLEIICLATDTQYHLKGDTIVIHANNDDLSRSSRQPPNQKVYEINENNPVHLDNSNNNQHKLK
ncbi:FecR family protein [Sphingobacterium allocomposti]|uniref:FecR family protein n=1 Tax=Sphingobacterium allocomposti TaxID=415956 RepID=A0A5S5D8B1_9SPHI|nr:FecR family protein [Sphingobacterium composti Yoo et al. 2007 non Ten et al. 2007]TYP92313.1 FecR family protein [Sphingobacterium composti Yoo et al. 2007 non Ten et al. 2007]